MKIQINILNAFTQNGRGGNPAAVVINADQLSGEEKQRIASKTGLSETAFVSRSAIADFKLDFYTPARQIAHCGHATIATFSYLKQNGMVSNPEISSKETIDEPRDPFFNGEVFMQQTAPKFIDLEQENLHKAATSLGLQGFTGTQRPLIVNTGNSFFILQVSDEQALQSLKPDFKKISELSKKYGLIGYYIFCIAENTGIDVTTRMFAPAYGIEEESATGMAAGPLACYLYTFGSKKDSYKIEQGRYMTPPSPSLINVKLTLENTEIKTLFAGGTATLTDQAVLEY